MGMVSESAATAARRAKKRKCPWRKTRKWVSRLSFLVSRQREAGFTLFFGK